ncbi:MAG: hypothetical protein EPN55_10660 [Gammaproteobacteria bacterium]|nr:MAG: hypothetical protein EPN55_10660 [Gammaproteobacteria bacterium]
MAKRRKSISNFRFRRYVRTPDSEGYYVFKARQRQSPSIAQFDYHVSDKVYYATLVVHTPLRQSELERLVEQLEDSFIEHQESRTDFILTIYSGKEIASYSDSIPESVRLEEPATLGAVADLSTAINRILGKTQHARGQLNEHALCAYFEALGFTARRAGKSLDHEKIDVVAENHEQIVYAQAKLGSVSTSEIQAVAAAVARRKDVVTGVSKMSVAAVAADRFPKDSEVLRRRLERQFGLPVMLIHKYQIAEMVPDYNRALGSGVVPSTGR